MFGNTFLSITGEENNRDRVFLCVSSAYKPVVMDHSHLRFCSLLCLGRAYIAEMYPHTQRLKRCFYSGNDNTEMFSPCISMIPLENSAKFLKEGNGD